MSESSAPDQFESISKKLFALADLGPGNGDPVDDGYGLRSHEAYRYVAPEWIGPIAFNRACCAVPGNDRNFGTHWGSNGNQQINLRVEVGGDAGLLYVYDPTWDEYAVIGTNVPLTAAEKVFARAQGLGDRVVLEEVATQLLNVPMVRPSLGPEQ